MIYTCIYLTDDILHHLQHLDYSDNHLHVLSPKKTVLAPSDSALHAYTSRPPPHGLPSWEDYWTPASVMDFLE